MVKKSKKGQNFYTTFQQQCGKSEKTLPPLSVVKTVLNEYYTKRAISKLPWNTIFSPAPRMGAIIQVLCFELCLLSCFCVSGCHAFDKSKRECFKVGSPVFNVFWTLSSLLVSCVFNFDNRRRVLQDGLSCVDMRWKIARSLETQEPVSLDSASLKWNLSLCFSEIVGNRISK